MHLKILIIATEAIFVFIFSLIAAAASLSLKEKIGQLSPAEQKNARSEMRFHALAYFLLGMIVAGVIATILYLVLIKA